MEYLSRITYSATGTVNYFAVPIAYMKKTDIHVLVDGVESAYVWLDDQTVQLSPMPAVGAQVEIYRDVDKKKRVAVFKDGSFLTESDMNLSATQQFMISQEAIDIAKMSMVSSDETTAVAKEAHDLSVAARDDAAEALSTSNTAIETAAQANTTAEAADTKADQVVAEVTEAVDRVIAAESAVAQKANIDGSNLIVADVLHALGFRDEDLNLDLSDLATKAETAAIRLELAPLDISTNGTYVLKVNGVDLARADLSNVDTSGFVGTNATNADAESFRSLVGMPEVESNITGLQTEVASTGSNVAAIASRVTVLENDDVQALCYAPQTIIAGATGDLPDGWTLEDCDAPAAHIFSSGTSELTIVAGLQVAAGYEGQVYISDVLAADTTLDISDLINATDGTGWIYSDIGTDGSQSFGYTENQPQVGIQKNDYSDFVPTLSANTDKGFIVSISSSYSTEYPPYKGYDGVITQNTGVITSSSAYSSLIGNESMYIELESGEAFETNGIMLMPYAVSSVLYGMPANFTIDGSDDGGENWTNVFTATGITDWKLQTYKCFTWDKVSYRKYRINCTKLAFSTYFALTEIKWLQPLSCDFFNIAKQTHYNANGNAIRRVYIGSVTVTAGVIDEIINFQHGTEYTEIINDYKNVTINAIYYPKKRYLGSCYPTARVYVESHWGRTGFFCYSGFSAGVRVWSTGESLSVHTAITYLTHVRSTNLATFTTYVTSAPCKITVKRGY